MKTRPQRIVLHYECECSEAGSAGNTVGRVRGVGGVGIVEDAVRGVEGSLLAILEAAVVSLLAVKVAVGPTLSAGIVSNVPVDLSESILALLSGIEVLAAVLDQPVEVTLVLAHLSSDAADVVSESGGFDGSLDVVPLMVGEGVLPAVAELPGEVPVDGVPVDAVAVVGALDVGEKLEIGNGEPAPVELVGDRLERGVSAVHAASSGVLPVAGCGAGPLALDLEGRGHGEDGSECEGSHSD